MREIAIITDTTSDLSTELYAKYNIEVLPLYVNFGNESFKDMYEVDGAKLYEMVEKYGFLPKTSGATYNDFYHTFEHHLKEGRDVIYMGIGGKLSMTLQNATLAAQELDPERIVLIDSQNLSTGISLQLIKIAKYAKMGLSIHEIKKEIENIRPQVKAQFVVESLDYLHKGGRCSSTARFFGKVLGIKPLIVVRDGSLSVGKKVFGSIKKAMKVMFQLFMEEMNANNVDLDTVFVTSTCAPKNAEYIKGLLDEAGIPQKIENIYYTEAGSVIASHCGKGTIGILYITKDKKSADDLLLEKE